MMQTEYSANKGFRYARHIIEKCAEAWERVVNKEASAGDVSM